MRWTIGGTFVVVLAISAFVFNEYGKKVKQVYQNDNVLGVNVVESTPYITSTAPTEAYVGELYLYTVRFSDKDTGSEGIHISLVSGPTWITVVGSKVFGIPPEGSEGPYKFTIQISDGVNYSTQDNYILVQDHAEE